MGGSQRCKGPVGGAALCTKCGGACAAGAKGSGWGSAEGSLVGHAAPGAAYDRGGLGEARRARASARVGARGRGRARHAAVGRA
jgi:hypothetical protein